MFQDHQLMDEGSEERVNEVASDYQKRSFSLNNVHFVDRVDKNVPKNKIKMPKTLGARETVNKKSSGIEVKEKNVK